MVSFFGLKFGADKKKKASTDTANPPQDWKRGDQDHRRPGDDELFEREIYNVTKKKKRLFSGSTASFSRPGSSSSAAGPRAPAFRPPYAPGETQKLAASSLRDLSQLGRGSHYHGRDTSYASSVRPAASDANLRTHWGNGSSTSLAAPAAPRSFATGRPGTASGAQQERRGSEGGAVSSAGSGGAPWARPRDAHIGRDTTLAPPKSPLGKFELKLDLPSGGGSLFDEKLDELLSPPGSQVASPASIARGSPELSRPSTAPAHKASTPFLPDPVPKLPSAEPASLASLHHSPPPLSIMTGAERPRRPTIESQGSLDIPAPRIRKDSALPALKKAATDPVAADEPASPAAQPAPRFSEDRNVPGRQQGQGGKAVIRDVRARRDTLALNPPKRNSLFMQIEELEKTLASAQRARSALAGERVRAESGSVEGESGDDMSTEESGPRAPALRPPPQFAAIDPGSAPQSLLPGPARLGRQPESPIRSAQIRPAARSESPMRGPGPTMPTKLLQSPARAPVVGPQMRIPAPESPVRSPPARPARPESPGVPPRTMKSPRDSSPARIPPWRTPPPESPRHDTSPLRGRRRRPKSPIRMPFSGPESPEDVNFATSPESGINSPPLAETLQPRGSEEAGGPVVQVNAAARLPGPRAVGLHPSGSGPRRRDPSESSSIKRTSPESPQPQSPRVADPDPREQSRAAVPASNFSRPRPRTATADPKSQPKKPAPLQLDTTSPLPPPPALTGADNWPLPSPVMAAPSSPPVSARKTRKAAPPPLQFVGRSPDTDEGQGAVPSSGGGIPRTPLSAVTAGGNEDAGAPIGMARGLSVRHVESSPGLSAQQQDTGTGTGTGTPRGPNFGLRSPTGIADEHGTGFI